LVRFWLGFAGYHNEARGTVADYTNQQGSLGAGSGDLGEIRNPDQLFGPCVSDEVTDLETRQRSGSRRAQLRDDQSAQFIVRLDGFTDFLRGIRHAQVQVGHPGIQITR
jgi:hypothetical protein